MVANLKEWERHLTLEDGKAIYVTSHSAGRRTALWSLLYGGDGGGFAPAFLRSGESLQPCVHCPIHSHRLRESHGLHRVDESTGEMLGVARLHDNPDNDSGEYAILVRSDLKSHGLGWDLMEMIITYGRSKGFRWIEGQVLHENLPMLDMCRELGFEISTDPDEPYICDVKLSL